MSWDSSALVPCVVPEAQSQRTTQLLSADTAITIWWTTPIECVSALEQKRRDPTHPLPADVYDSACERLAAIASTADEVQPSEALRERARHYLGQHPLRAADALQLAAAFVAHQPTVATLDNRLRAAAEAEGFVVVP